MSVTLEGYLSLKGKKKQVNKKPNFGVSAAWAVTRIKERREDI